MEKFQALASTENLESTVVAEVTAEPRLVMELDGRTIVNLSRTFLNSNGAKKFTSVSVPEPAQEVETLEYLDFGTRMERLAGDLNICSQKGLVERFDSTIGAGTVLMPFGGKWQLTPSQAMAAKIPVLDGETTTCSLMGWGLTHICPAAVRIMGP